jgi:hypothetical protein
MLGMEDLTITIAWLATVLSMVWCVLYGLVTWNKGDDEEESQ